MALNLLRNTGNLNWNMDSSLNKGELITSRRPNPYNCTDPTGFTICPYCFGSYRKTGLRQHVNRYCPRKPKVDENTRGERVITALATSIQARHHQNASIALKNVYKSLRDDDLSRSIKFDWLITAYGNKLSAKHTQRKSKLMIKGRLRILGRVLRELKRINPEITDLATAYKPVFFDSLVEAIQAVGRLNDDQNEYCAPATASICVTVVKEVGRVLINQYIKQTDPENQRITENFMTLMDSDIHDLINKTVNENRGETNRHKQINMPTMGDVHKFAQYLKSESSDCFDKLSTSFDYETWMQLSKLIMASIIVFNRKRVGDTENITVKDFEFKEMVNEKTNEQLYACLSEKSKEIVKQYCRLYVRGKRNSTVSVILNVTMQKYINLLISHRENAGIPPKNKYLFALPSSTGDIYKTLNAGTTLHKFAKLCGAENPSSLIGTNMRKHIATVCVSLELNDTDVADIADFMGHHELVHRKVYRQNPIDRQLVRISQVLEVAQGNVTANVAKKATDVRSTAVRKRKKPSLNSPTTGKSFKN